MNYINIKGERINLEQVSGYSRHDKAVVFIFPVFDENDDEQINLWVNFDSPIEAAQCINFLDKKTKCETFKLANPE